MPNKAAPSIPKYLNVKSEALDIALANRPQGIMSIPTEDMSSPFWELVYLRFMYETVYAENRKKGITNVRYSLLHPPLWLITIGGLMWQGILQGATWDVVKTAIAKALDKLRGAGLAPVADAAQSTLNARWTKYASSGKKQYEMFLSLKKTARQLPDRHLQAYAEAKSPREFGQIMRCESDRAAIATHKPEKKTAKSAKAVVRKARKT
jgi:hypothetical protein